MQSRKRSSRSPQPPRSLSWAELQVRFIRGGSSLWHPNFELSEHWFRRNLIDYDLWYIVEGDGYLRDAEGQVTEIRRGMRHPRAVLARARRGGEVMSRASRAHLS